MKVPRRERRRDLRGAPVMAPRGERRRDLRGAPVRLALAGLIGVLLLAGIAGLVAVDDDADTTLTADQNTTTTTGPARSTTTLFLTPETTPGGPTDTSVPGATSEVTGTTAAGGNMSAPPPPAAPGPTRPPAAASYGYALSTAVGGGGAQQTADSIVVQALGDAGGKVRQKLTTKRGGFANSNEVVWSGDRAEIELTTVGQQGFDLACRWDRPVLLYAGGLRMGLQWSVDSSCTGQITVPQCGALTYRVRQTSTNTVTGSATVSVAGQALRVWEIRRANWTVAIQANSQSCSVASTVIIQGREQFAPEQGVIVTSDDSLSSSTAFNEMRLTANSREVRALQSL